MFDYWMERVLAALMVVVFTSLTVLLVTIAAMCVKFAFFDG